MQAYNLQLFLLMYIANYILKKTKILTNNNSFHRWNRSISFLYGNQSEISSVNNYSCKIQVFNYAYENITIYQICKDFESQVLCFLFVNIWLLPCFYISIIYHLATQREGGKPDRVLDWQKPLKSYKNIIRNLGLVMSDSITWPQLQKGAYWNNAIFNRRF